MPLVLNNVLNDLGSSEPPIQLASVELLDAAARTMQVCNHIGRTMSCVNSHTTFFSTGVGECFRAPVFKRRKCKEVEGRKFEHRQMLDIEYTMLLPAFQYS